jgi:hypothetical protein
VKTVREEVAKVRARDDTLIEGRRTFVFSVKFDERGKLIEKIDTNPDGSIRQKLGWATSYDPQGRELGVAYYNGAGRLTSRSVITYDSSGKKVQTTYFNPNHTVNHHQLYVYDENGNKVQETHLNPDGTARVTIKYRYDGGNLPTEVTYYKSDGTLSTRHVYADDKQKNQRMWIGYKEGVVVRKSAEVYGENGIVSEAHEYGSRDAPHTKSTYSYEFDSVGNWVKRIAVIERLTPENRSIEIDVRYRSFTYY